MQEVQDNMMPLLLYTMDSRDIKKKGKMGLWTIRQETLIKVEQQEVEQQEVEQQGS